MDFRKRSGDRGNSEQAEDLRGEDHGERQAHGKDDGGRGTAGGLLDADVEVHQQMAHAGELPGVSKSSW